MTDVLYLGLNFQAWLLLGIVFYVVIIIILILIRQCVTTKSCCADCPKIWNWLKCRGCNELNNYCSSLSCCNPITDTSMEPSCFELLPTCQIKCFLPKLYYCYCFCFDCSLKRERGNNDYNSEEYVV